MSSCQLDLIRFPALRLYGSGPSMLERVVPESLQGGFAIKGYKIPPG